MEESMNKMTIALVIIIMALSFCLGMTRQSKAQDKGFEGIMPFVTSTDRVGFLDQSNGRIYMYDSNLSKCLFVGQIQNLGEPIQTIAAETTSSNL
jgi:hypothetical protein